MDLRSVSQASGVGEMVVEAKVRAMISRSAQSEKGRGPLRDTTPRVELI